MALKLVSLWQSNGTQHSMQYLAINYLFLFDINLLVADLNKNKEYKVYYSSTSTSQLVLVLIY